jgi:hypothetical protein
MGCGKTEFARLLEDSFVEPLSPEKWERLRGHLAACDSCRGDYDRLAKLELALAKEDGPVPTAHLEMLGQAVLARVAATAPRKQSRLARWWKAAAVALPAGVAAAALLAVHTPRDDGFQARSSGESEVEGVRGFCIEGEAGTALVRGSTDFGPEAELRCRRSGALQFSYSSGKEARFLSIASVDPAGGNLLRYTATSSVEVEPEQLDATLPYSTRLEARHAPGERVLVALFSGRALSDAELEAAVLAVVAGEPAEAPVRVARRARLITEE